MVKRILAALAITLGTLGFFSTATAAATPQQDGQFFSLLAQQGIEPGPNAVSTAYVVCSQVWGGTNPYWMASVVLRDNPSLDYDLAKRYVAAAIIVYCPPPDRSTGTLYT